MADLADLYAKPGHLIRRCQQIAVAIFHDVCAEFDLTPVQFAALSAIAARPGVDQITLSGLIAIDRTTTGHVVGRLEGKGLIRRGEGSDRRTRTLTVTNPGLDLLARVTPKVDEAQDRILGPLDPAERAQFVSLAAKLVNLNNEISRVPLKPTPRAAE